MATVFDPFDAFDPIEPAPAPEPARRRRWSAAASRPVQPKPPLEAPTPPTPAASASVPLADLAAFRASALSELRTGVDRLRSHGHSASLTDALDAEEPTVTVQLRADPGPLARGPDLSRDPARFELRIAADHDGGAQVVAGYARGSVGAPFTLLGRKRVDQMDRDWVARRFIDFVQRVLELR